MRTSRIAATIAACFSIPSLLALPPAFAGDAFNLQEDGSADRTWQVSVDVTGDGTFEFQPPEEQDKPVTHPVTLNAAFRFTGRRLPPAGRDEAAFRALRQFEKAESSIRVGGQTSSPVLRADRSRIVARVTRAGVVSYATAGPLTATEAELLPFPADPLPLAALLPDRSVTVGESWTPPAWAGTALAGIEVALKQKSTCRLDSVENDEAIVSFTCEIEGATKGATSTVALAGSMTCDLKRKAVVAARVTHSEKRSIGPLSPGMTLKLTSHLRRTPASDAAAIADEAVATVPLEPEAEALWIEYQTPFGIVLACDRGWRVFHQSDSLLILRLLDRGGLIAQCNLAAAPTVPAGQRTPGRLLEDAVRKSLGEEFTEIVDTEEVELGGEATVYRVVVSGKAEKDDQRLWRYYLVTAPDGRQAELVFTLEPDHVDRLADRDLELVSSLAFLRAVEPTPASKTTAPDAAEPAPAEAKSTGSRP